MKNQHAERWLPWLGVLLIAAAILFASGQTYDIKMFFPEDAKPYYLPMHIVPMVAYGLMIAGGLMLTGCLRPVESPWETIPAIVIGLIPLLFGSYPFFGGVVAKETWMGVPMETIGILFGVALLQFLRALWQRKPWTHCNMKRLLLYTGMILLVCAVSITFERLFHWVSNDLQTNTLAEHVRIDQLIHRIQWAACYLCGATILPFLHFEKRRIAISLTLLVLSVVALFACVYILRIDTNLLQKLRTLPEPLYIFTSYIYKSLAAPTKVEGASVLFFAGLCGLLPWRKVRRNGKHQNAETQ